jgi:two-component system cell cycle sensor histidine kinase/response regulator CckA
MRTNHHILVMDDDQMVREYMQVALERSEFQVSAPESVSEAMSIIERTGDRIDAVVSDVDMPGMDGFAFAGAVSDRRPGLPILLVSGKFPERAAAQRFEFLQKPFRPGELARAVTALLAKVRNIEKCAHA